MTARPIMVQGTMSNVGKSVLAAGLCRVFSQDGYRVAPFKAQNMALNSGVTADGLEMGRAQIMQAEAAGVSPDVSMNPILLKPEGDVGSQVIVLGEAVASMPAREYFRYRPRLADTVRDAYAGLARENDIVVIEGAGSPAEVNLGRDLFVNMGMAAIADAPVLLVGDIDPGGVFAQLYGTLELLGPDDRARVRGLLINKFRGDPSLLEPGLADLGARCGVPVLGVVPYTPLDLDDEDSLSGRLARASQPHAAALDIAVVRLPRLSNFTDFSVLDCQPTSGVRYVTDARELGRPDLVVLPGSKRTMDDLAWLKRSGIARCIRALAGQGTPVIGICGGFQMLGGALEDPYGTEGGGAVEGLGLLPVSTVFGGSKRTARTATALKADEGVFHALDGLTAEGYEIHTGHTEPAPGARAITVESPAGGLLAASRGNIWGTYLHGVFDASAVTQALMAALLQARGLPAREGAVPNWGQRRQAAYDKLADALRKSVDMEAVYRIMGVAR